MRVGIWRHGVAGKPLWQLLAELSPAQVVELVDFRYLADALTPRRRWCCSSAASGRVASSALAALVREGYPAYTTAPGWLVRGWQARRAVQAAG